MSACFVTLTPEIEAILSTPQSIGKFATSYGQHLADNYAPGSDRGWAIAGRLEDCSTSFSKHECARGHVFFVTNRCGRKSCFVCAEIKAQAEAKRYGLLEKEPFQAITYIEIREEVDKLARKVLGKLKAPLLANIGFRGRMVSKMMLLMPIQAIPDKVVRKLQQLDYELKMRPYAKECFGIVLQRVLAPDIPNDLENRLHIEKLKRQLHFQGMSQKDRKKLLVVSDHPHTNNFAEEPSTDGAPKHVEKVPRCTQCGSPSVRRTQTMKFGTLLSEERWRPTVFMPPKSPEQFQEFG